MVLGNGATIMTQDEIDQMHPKEAVAMNAMTVEDHEAEEKRERRRKQKLQEETQRLKRDIASNDSRNKPPQNNGIVVAFATSEQSVDDSDEDDSDDDKSDDSSNGGFKRIIIIVLIFAVLIGAGCAAYFLVLSDKKVQATTNTTDATASPTTKGPTTEAPSRTPPPTAISTLPTTAPTVPPLKYPPPSEEDCEAMSNGRPVDGRDEKLQVQLVIVLDVSLSMNANPRVVAEDLKLDLQERMISELAGCGESGLRRRLANHIDGDPPPQREDYRFLIADGVVTNVQRVAGCIAPLPTWNCHQMEAHLDVFLNGDEPKYGIISILSESFENLARTLGWNPTTRSIDLDSIILLEEPPIDPPIVTTMAPTKVAPSNPTDSPSSPPSHNPTAVVVQPTDLPSKSPTKKPTGRPTPWPTSKPDSDNNEDEDFDDWYNCDDDFNDECWNDLALEEADVKVECDMENIPMLVPCSVSKNPIVAYVITDWNSCSGTCVGKTLPDSRSCGRYGSIPLILKGDYTKQKVVFFQAKDFDEVEDCPDNQLLPHLEVDCTDYPFMDTLGNDCSYYSSNYEAFDCPLSAYDLDDPNTELNPFEACCHCGGGDIQF